MPPKAKPCPELTAALEAIALLTIRIEKLEKTNSDQVAKITELKREERRRWQTVKKRGQCCSITKNQTVI
jgi:hypothetical protein